jgi:CBS domain containing-hemolysin-like protein
VLELGVIIASIIFAAFYAGSEIGMYCTNRLRLRLQAEKGDSAARSLQQFFSRPRLALNTMLVGTNVGLYVATVLCAQKIHETRWADEAELYSSIIMPPVLLVFAELIPKSVFQHHADMLMYHIVWPLKISRILFYPVTVALRAVSVVVPRLVSRHPLPRPALFTPEAFRYYVGEAAELGVLSDFQEAMTENILRLKSVPVTAVMTALDEVIMAPEEVTYGEILGLLRAHRHSRIPLYKGSLDNIVGVISIVDVASLEGAPGPIGEFARGVLSVRKGTSVADALWTLRQARQHLAVVVDEQSRALGIVTVKDLVEQIVGELRIW